MSDIQNNDTVAIAFHVIAAPRSLRKAKVAPLIEAFRRDNKHLQLTDLDHHGANFFVTGEDKAALAFILQLRQIISEKVEYFEDESDVLELTSHMSSEVEDDRNAALNSHYSLWAPGSENANYRPHPRTLEKIEHLTTCSIRPAEGSSFSVRGDVFSFVQSAVQKLNTIAMAERTKAPQFYDCLCGVSASTRLVFRSIDELRRLRKQKDSSTVADKADHTDGRMYLVVPMGVNGQPQLPSPSKRVLEPRDLWKGFGWQPVGLVTQEPADAARLGLSRDHGECRGLHRINPENDSMKLDTKVIRRVRKVQQDYPFSKSRKLATEGALSSAQERNATDSGNSGNSGNCLNSLLDDITDEQQQMPDSYTLLTPSNLTSKSGCSPNGTAVHGSKHETEMIRSLLQSARAYPGPVALSLAFGKILVHPDSMRKQMRSRPIPEETWSSKMHGAKTIGTLFSSRLTNMQAEAESILDIKLRKGRQPFVFDPLTRAIRFELHCQSDAGEQIMVDIDEEGTPKVQSSRKVFGGLNLFCPKSAWDARIAVEAPTFTHGDFDSDASKIAKSLKVRPLVGDTAVVSMRCENFALKILRGMAVRETMHQCQDHPDMVLKLSEFRDLQLQVRESETTFYEGQIRSCADLASRGLVWWKASIESLSANAIIRSGSNHGFGDLATWEPEDVASDGLIGNMMKMADEIVSRMDHLAGAY